MTSVNGKEFDQKNVSKGFLCGIELELFRLDDRLLSVNQKSHLANRTQTNKKTKGEVKLMKTKYQTLVTAAVSAAIIIVVGAITFLSTRSKNVAASLTFTSFICFFVGLLLRFMNLVNDAVLTFLGIGLAGSVILLIRERNVENV